MCVAASEPAAGPAAGGSSEEHEISVQAAEHVTESR